MLFLEIEVCGLGMKNRWERGVDAILMVYVKYVSFGKKVTSVVLNECYNGEMGRE